MNNPFFDPHNFSNDNDEDIYQTQEDKLPSKQTTQALKKLLFVLLSIGLVIGIVSSWVIVKLMNRYGLTEKTNQLEQIQE